MTPVRNAAIFSCFNQMLLESLNVPRPAELVNLGAPEPKPGSQNCGQAGDCNAVFSYAMFRDLLHGLHVSPEWMSGRQSVRWWIW